MTTTNAEATRQHGMLHQQQDGGQYPAIDAKGMTQPLYPRLPRYNKTKLIYKLISSQKFKNLFINEFSLKMGTGV